jgi:hypothetical protein
MHGCKTCTQLIAFNICSEISGYTWCPSTVKSIDFCPTVNRAFGMGLGVLLEVLLLHNLKCQEVPGTISKKI